MIDENKAYDFAIRCIATIANVSAESRAFGKFWSEKFTVKNSSEVFDSVKTQLSHDMCMAILNLPEEKKLNLGFRKWSKETNKMLIPLWFIECLPDDFNIEVTCIDNTKTSIKNIDKDIRGGCVAYMY